MSIVPDPRIDLFAHLGLHQVAATNWRIVEEYDDGPLTHVVEILGDRYLYDEDGSLRLDMDARRPVVEPVNVTITTTVVAIPGNRRTAVGPKR